MAFAIWYNDQDLVPLADGIQAVSLSGLSQQDKQMALRCWNGGLRDFRTAPFESILDRHASGSADTRRVVINATNVSLLDFRNLLYRIAAQIPGAEFLRSLADDMRNGLDGGQDPYP